GGGGRPAVGSLRCGRPLGVGRARRRWRRIVRGFAAVVAHSTWAFSRAGPAVSAGARVLWAHDAFAGTHWTERKAARLHPSLVICNSEFTSRALRACPPPPPPAAAPPPV